MWPFTKKKKKVEEKPTQTVPAKTYAQLKQEYSTLEIENAEKEEECAKNGDSWQEMLLKTKYIQERMSWVDKEMRKIQEPALTFNKRWKAKRFTLDEFIEAAVNKELTDTDGAGFYATETAKTDISIYPTDIIENMYRTDFPYVLWFNK